MPSPADVGRANQNAGALRNLPCPICLSPMQTVKGCTWVRECPGCNFASADLGPGIGADVGGIESLRRRNFRIILDELARQGPLPGLRLLEVGCSTGWFLDEALERGAHVRGVEPDHRSAARARERGHDVVTGRFPDALFGAEPRLYDVLVFNDVFEHLPDIAAAKSAIARMLAPNGRLVVNLPDREGFLYRIAALAHRLGWRAPLERLWQKGMASPHLSYFTSANLRRFFIAGGDFHALSARRLETLVLPGLWTRLRSGGQSLLSSAVLYPPLATLAIVSRWVASDIQLQIFRYDPDRAGM